MVAKGVSAEVVRRLIREEGLRPDGRAVDAVRPITSRAGLLPRTHGSVLFTRGETQVGGPQEGCEGGWRERGTAVTEERGQPRMWCVLMAGTQRGCTWVVPTLAYSPHVHLAWAVLTCLPPNTPAAAAASRPVRSPPPPPPRPPPPPPTTTTPSPPPPPPRRCVWPRWAVMAMRSAATASAPMSPATASTCSTSSRPPPWGRQGGWGARVGATGGRGKRSWGASTVWAGMGRCSCVVQAG
jgi:hypothetical protein